jgi:hypothetical protein
MTRRLSLSVRSWISIGFNNYCSQVLLSSQSPYPGPRDEELVPLLERDDGMDLVRSPGRQHA